MSLKETKKNEIRTNRSKARKLPKEKGLKGEDGRLNPHRAVADFPPKLALPLGRDRYFGQTCKLLRPIYASSAQADRDFPQALDGEFGMYQGVRNVIVSGCKYEDFAVIKFAYVVGVLPDDGTWFEVID